MIGVKRIIAYVVCGILIVGVLACCSIYSFKEWMRASNTNNSTESQIIRQMEEHLYSKYGYIDYEIKGFISSGWDHPYDLMNCSVVVDGFEESFSVERHSEDGKYFFQDSYFGLVIKDEFEKEVNKYASKYFENFKIYAGLTYDNYPNELNVESSFFDMLEMKSKIFNITFFVLVKEYDVPIEEFNNDAKMFINDWSNVGLSSTPRLLYLNEEVYETTNTTEFNKLFDENKIIAEYSENVN